MRTAGAWSGEGQIVHPTQVLNLLIRITASSQSAWSHVPGSAQAAAHRTVGPWQMKLENITEASNPRAETFRWE